MDTMRRLERSIYPCEEINCDDYARYPYATDEEFVCMESESVDRSYVHIFPYVRKNDKESYVEIYVYDSMLYPYACFRRFIILDKCRMKEEDEDAFLAYICYGATDTSVETNMQFTSFCKQVEAVFPQWHLKTYSIRTRTNVFMHLYFVSQPGPREILFKADLWVLGIGLHEIHSHNLLGSSPEAICNAPLKLLRILNDPDLFDYVLRADALDKAIEIYRKYASYIGNSGINIYQFMYLEQLFDNDGFFAGHTFMRSLFNCLGVADADELETYNRYIQYRDKLPIKLKMKLPTADEVKSETDRLERILSYCDESSKELQNIDCMIRERKERGFYEYDSKDGTYSVILPESSLDICKEALYQRSCLMNYIQAHANLETTILFIRKKGSSLPFVTMEIKNYIIREVRGRFNCLPKKEVFAFLKEYAQNNWVYYDPYNLLFEAVYGGDEYDCDKELREYFDTLESNHDNELRERCKWEDTCRQEYVQLSMEDCFSDMSWD